MSGEVYVKKLADLSSALTRLNTQAKDVRKKQGETRAQLAQWMERNGLEDYQGYKLSKIKPRPKIKRKPPKERKLDTLRIFSEIGVPDPDELWNRLQDVQKYDPLPTTPIDQDQ